MLVSKIRQGLIQSRLCSGKYWAVQDIIHLVFIHVVLIPTGFLCLRVQLYQY